MTKKSQETITSPSAQFEHTENFASSYANSVILESSAWDLKLIFGQLETGKGGGTLIKQHLAVTIPWTQAKLALFWLRVHVEGAEAAVKAKIPIRSDLLPPEVPALTPSQKKDPAATEFFEAYKRARQEFLATL